MEADRVRAMLVDVEFVRHAVARGDDDGAIIKLGDLARKLGAELPPVHGAFAGALNGATLRSR